MRCSSCLKRRCIRGMQSKMRDRALKPLQQRNQAPQTPQLAACKQLHSSKVNPNHKSYLCILPWYQSFPLLMYLASILSLYFPRSSHLPFRRTRSWSRTNGLLLLRLILVQKVLHHLMESFIPASDKQHIISGDGSAARMACEGFEVDGDGLYIEEGCVRNGFKGG